MPGAAKEGNSRKWHKEDDERTLQSMKRELKPHNPGHSSLLKGNCLAESNGNVILNTKKSVNKHNVASKKRLSLSGLKDKHTRTGEKESERTDDRDGKCRELKRRRRRKKRTKCVELDEASRLQRRTRYLLVKVKLEQNLIDAYSTEGWKGQSREKIRPEKELQRAQNEILKCKLGIREAIHQLDLLSSEGHISDSAVAPDGSVHHEHIICAKCELREALPDNDIILCDGTCNRAFHQKCLDPPLSSENIPPGDEGWFCKFCKKKMEILEATNAHLGTQFPVDSNWQDIFKEEAALPDGGNSLLHAEEEWPSDDSEDDDYDPDRIGPSCSDNGVSRSECDDDSDCSSSFLGSLEDEALLASGEFGERRNRSLDNSRELTGVDSDEANSGEIVRRPRQRAAVDYIKLYDEMFGKHATENEQISDDEDWGPTKRKRKVKETDAASTLMTLVETAKRKLEEGPSELEEKQLTNRIKRPIFRLPNHAVEKLRLAFAENELPTRALRVSLAKQLGLEFEKVNKWFKNARYLALKARKEERAHVSDDVSPKESPSESAKGSHPDQIASRNNVAAQNYKGLKKYVRRKNTDLLINSFRKKRRRRKPLLQRTDSNQMTTGDDVSLKHLREKAKEAKKSKSRDAELEAEAEMERLCEIKTRVENLQRVVSQLPTRRVGKASTINSIDPCVIYVPVAELREKR